jgi:hypothetical protein
MLLLVKIDRFLAKFAPEESGGGISPARFAALL